MYSRYIPNRDGGYDRRLVPDRPRPEPPDGAAIGCPPEASGNRPPPAGAGIPDGPPLRPPHPVGAGAPSPRFPAGSGVPDGPRPSEPRPPPRPPVYGRVPTPGGPAGGLFGLNALLGGILPRPLDSEDLLVLAVLLLAMKQDGAAPMELLIAAAIYLMF